MPVRGKMTAKDSMSCCCISFLVRERYEKHHSAALRADKAVPAGGHANLLPVTKCVMCLALNEFIMRSHVESY